ncbi:MAG: DUF4339 domain-containing protein [Thermoguttaceae bacterium]|jgi:hypothetical protein|nr:DUF4339 domain-containing protein [Thermoguttaceae bacterium]
MNPADFLTKQERAMSGRYFLRIRGSILGPFRTDQVRQLLHEARIGPLDEVSADRTTWRPPGEFSEFSQFVRPIASRSPTLKPTPTAPSAAATASGPNLTAQPALASSELWYYQHDGQQHGPVDHASMVSLIELGRIAPATLVRSAQWPNWVPLNQTHLAACVPRDVMSTELPSTSASPEKAAQQDDSSTWLAAAVILLVILILLVAASDTDCQSTSRERTRYMPVPIYRRPVEPVPRFKPRKAAPTRPLFAFPLQPGCCDIGWFDRLCAAAAGNLLAISQ